jgi:hypothetical protein
VGATIATLRSAANSAGLEPMISRCAEHATSDRLAGVQNPGPLSLT